MRISLQIDEKLAKHLECVARERGLSKSEVLRLSLSEFLSREPCRPTAWELGKELFGRHSSGHEDLSESGEKIIRALMAEPRK